LAVTGPGKVGFSAFDNATGTAATALVNAADQIGPIIVPNGDGGFNATAGSTTALATCYDGATCTPTRVGVTTTVNPHGAFTATFDSPSSAITKPVSYICVGRN